MRGRSVEAREWGGESSRHGHTSRHESEKNAQKHSTFLGGGRGGCSTERYRTVQYMLSVSFA